MDNNIFTDKSDEQARKFYFITTGVYISKLDILQDMKVRLDKLLKLEHSDKSEIKKLKEQIKKLKIEVETIEFLHKCAFD